MSGHRTPHGFDPMQPFTREQATAAGITDAQLRGPAYRRIFYDVYLVASVTVTPRIRAVAALGLCGEDAHISHFSAAELWGAWVPDDPNVHVSVRERAQRRQRRGLKSHLAHPRSQVVVHRGLRMSSPLQTFLELAKYLDLVDLVVLGDSFIHKQLLTPDGLLAAADGWPGHCARHARRAARLVRAGVESPMETRLRLLVVLAGLPEPEVNITITDVDGARTMRLDLSYPSLKLAIEYDGRQHAEDSRQWRHDITRRERLDRLGWRLIVVTSDGLFTSPEQTLGRILSALRDRGAAPAVALNDEWRRHFPGRASAA